MQPIRVLIFDFDGTMLDTEMPIFLGWQRVYASFKQELTHAQYSKVVGSGYNQFDPKKELERRLGRTLDWQQIDRERRKFALDLIHQKDILPGVRALVLEARSRGIRCAVASGSSVEWVGEHLERLGLRGCFELLSCAGTTFPTKPAPDVYLQVLGYFGISGAEAFAIEDSPHGVAAAIAAGIACIAVPNSLTEPLQFPPGCVSVATLEGRTLDSLVALARAKLT